MKFRSMKGCVCVTSIAELHADFLPVHYFWLSAANGRFIDQDVGYDTCDESAFRRLAQSTVAGVRCTLISKAVTKTTVRSQRKMKYTDCPG